jgi:hypothetical protein
MPPVHKRLHIYLDTTALRRPVPPEGGLTGKTVSKSLHDPAIFLLPQGQDLAKGYLAAKTTLKAYFPSLPHLSRFYRVLQKAPELLAHLAVRLSGGQGLLQVVDLKPIPLAHGHRVHGLNLPEAAVGVGPLGAFGGYVLMPVMNERGLFWNLAPSGLTRWALLPGNARETWGRDLVADLPAVLGDRGFRWVQGVKTPPYRVRGGRWWRRGGGGGSRTSVSCWGGSGTGLRRVSV